VLHVDMGFFPNIHVRKKSHVDMRQSHVDMKKPHVNMRFFPNMNFRKKSHVDMMMMMSFICSFRNKNEGFLMLT
jgi:hypothetical protein